MKIFLPDYDTRYANAVVANENDVMKLSFDGTSRIKQWEPIEIISPFKSRKIVDFMYYTPAAIIASDKAVGSLQSLIGPYVEVLPLQCAWGEYYILNVLSLLDCVNYTESEYIPFGDRKTAAGAPVVLKITKHVFYEDRIGTVPIFKDINRPQIPLYVNETFVENVNRFKLKGLKFEQIWEGKG